MKKIECDIYRDLFPNYIKDKISDTTKKFVDNHLNECTSCKSIMITLICIINSLIIKSTSYYPIKNNHSTFG